MHDKRIARQTIEIGDHQVDLARGEFLSDVHREDEVLRILDLRLRDRQISIKLRFRPTQESCARHIH